MTTYKMNEHQFDWILAIATGMVGAQVLSIQLSEIAYAAVNTIAPELIDLIKFFGAIIGGLMGSALTMYGKYKIEEMKLRRAEKKDANERQKSPPL